MASKRGSALLIEQAEARVNHLLPALATYLGIDMQPMPTHRDPMQQKVLQTQWFADTLEAIDRAVVELQGGSTEVTGTDATQREHLNDLARSLGVEDPTRFETEDALIAAIRDVQSGPIPGDDTTVEDTDAVVLDAGFDQEHYQDLKLDQLKSIAVLAGAPDEDVTKLRSKAEVIEVIESRVAAEDFDPVMFTVGDDGEIERFDPPETGADEAGPGPGTGQTSGEGA